MPVSLLAPLFVAGLAALAIPIIVHLTHKERDEPVRFPSLMFLERIPFKTVRRQRIRNWFLFLLRALAIVLLVVAFARPLYTGDEGTVRTLLGAREIVIVLDRSFSMRYGDRWERALDEARSVVSGMNEGDVASLVVFDGDATVSVSTSSDRVGLEAAINGVLPGSGTTGYPGALKLARQILDESTQPRLQLVLISDYQRAGWSNDEFIVMPEGTTIDNRVVGGDDLANAAVAGVFVDRNYSGGRERIVVSARLINRSVEPVRGRHVGLVVDGREMEGTEADIEPNATATVTFPAMLMPEGASLVSVVMEADNLPADDSYNLVLSGARPLNVLILDNRGANARSGLFLRRSLAVGNRPTFDVETKTVRRTSGSDFSGRSLVILNDVPFPTGSTGAALRRFVENGGGLFVVLGERSRPASWSAESRALLPGTFAGAEDRSDERGATLAFVEYTHPVFEVFNGPRSGDLAAARFFRYRGSNGVPSENVLARFDDGTVALAENGYGQGRVLVWTSTMDDFWNDLPLKPVYLPLVHEIAKRAADYAEARLAVTAGDVVDLEADPDVAATLAAAAGTADGEIVIEAPSGRETAWHLDDDGRFLQLTEHGFYRVRSLDGATSIPFAANVDPRESDLTRIDVDEVTAAMAPQTGGTSRAGVDIELTPEDLERRQAAWWYLIVGVFALVTLETIVSNRNSGLSR